MAKWWMFVIAACLVSWTAGCASSGSGQNNGDGDGSLRPTLSVSMTRNVPERDVAEPLPSLEDDMPKVSTETGVSFYRIQVGDPIIINLRGIYPRDEKVEDVVDEDGNVTIPLVGDIQASGKSTSQFESDITRMYIDGGYYRSITVNVVIPSRTYFIRGEVKAPGRYQIVGGITIMQAIAAASGYTEFANQKKVKLIRGDKRIKINMRDIEKDPDKDIRLESGDVIVVDRSIL